MLFGIGLLQEFDEASTDDRSEVKSMSPDPIARRTRPRYKVICEGERHREFSERLEKLYPFVDQQVLT